MANYSDKLLGLRPLAVGLLLTATLGAHGAAATPVPTVADIAAAAKIAPPEEDVNDMAQVT